MQYICADMTTVETVYLQLICISAVSFWEKTVHLTSGLEAPFSSWRVLVE